MKCPFCVQPDGRAYKTKVIETRNYWEPNQKVFYVGEQVYLNNHIYIIDKITETEKCLECEISNKENAYSQVSIDLLSKNTKLWYLSFGYHFDKPVDNLPPTAEKIIEKLKQIKNGF